VVDGANLLHLVGDELVAQQMELLLAANAMLEQQWSMTSFRDEARRSTRFRPWQPGVA